MSDSRSRQSSLPWLPNNVSSSSEGMPVTHRNALSQGRPSSAESFHHGHQSSRDRVDSAGARNHVPRAATPNWQSNPLQHPSHPGDPMLPVTSRAGYWSTVMTHNCPVPAANVPGGHSHSVSVVPNQSSLEPSGSAAQGSMGGGQWGDAVHYSVVPNTRPRANASHVTRAGDAKASQKDPVAPRARRFQCGLCERSFERKGHLDEHVDSIHNNVRRFACPYCARQFGHRSSMRRHVSIMHAGAENEHGDREVRRRYQNPPGERTRQGDSTALATSGNPQRRDPGGSSSTRPLTSRESWHAILGK